MTDRVRIDIQNHIADVRLVRSDKMNALDDAMFQAIIEAIDALRNEPDLRCVVLSGEGRAFCAGLDLSNFKGEGGVPSDLLARTHGLANRPQAVAWRWRDLPVPVIAAVHGIAFGGGFQIMSGADIRFMHPETRCAIMELKWGLVPDMAGYPLWRGNVRDDVLRKLVYTNAEFSGEQAQQMGFATELSEHPFEDAMALAELITRKNPDAIRSAKTLSNMLGDASDGDLLLAESREQAGVIHHPNQLEAVAAEMQGRPPVFNRRG